MDGTPRSMIGTSLKRYEILDELGQGGMSVVYRGRDPALDREVAVKVLHDHLAAQAENRERFRREAKAIARLDHPRILDVHDFSGEEDDYSYIVMEYVPGQTLREHVDAHGSPPPEIAAMIGLAIADALKHAHDHGVIHRDLKPENVMVSESGIVKLMDFGIAHVVDAETMTQTGNLLGSPAHMAPEIIDGRDVNPRSDIFSLGTVLYWLGTGSFPFHGDNPSHLLREVLECNYDDPSLVEPRLPRSLAETIDRCLARDPDDRFESVEALTEHLCGSLEAIDVPDLDEELSAYFQHPEDYVESFEEAIVDRLVALGHEAMEHDDVPEAMARYDRVLAYDPDNEEVSGQLDRLDARQTRRQWIVVGAVVLTLIGVGSGLGWYFVSLDRERLRLERAQARAERALETGRTAAHRQSAIEAGRRRAARIGWRTRTQLSAHRARMLARLGILRGRQLAEHISSLEPSDARAAAAVPSSRDDRRPDPSPDEPSSPSETAPPPSNGGPDAGSQQPASSEPTTYTYKFKVLPLAATVYVDGEAVSAPRAARQGFELTEGRHTLRVVSARCHPQKRIFRVDGPQARPMSLALEWKDARVRVNSNRPAVVYLDGDRSKSYPIGAGGQNASIRVPFGRADSDRNSSRKRLTLEILPRDNLQLKRQHSVVLRPGEETSINVNFD